MTVVLFNGNSMTTMTTILFWLLLMSSSCVMNTMMMYPVAADETAGESFYGDEDFAMPQEIYDSYCDLGPDALTDAFADENKSIPRTCFDVPYNSDNGPLPDTTMTIERCYYTYVPETCNSDAAASTTTDSSKQEQLLNNLNLPLVFDIHSLTSCPLLSARFTGWLEKAEEECFVVVWPIGSAGKLKTFFLPILATTTSILSASFFKIYPRRTIFLPVALSFFIVEKFPTSCL